MVSNFTEAMAASDALDIGKRVPAIEAYKNAYLKFVDAAAPLLKASGAEVDRLREMHEQRFNNVIKVVEGKMEADNATEVLLTNLKANDIYQPAVRNARVEDLVRLTELATSIADKTRVNGVVEPSEARGMLLHMLGAIEIDEAGGLKHNPESVEKMLSQLAMANGTYIGKSYEALEAAEDHVIARLQQEQKARDAKEEAVQAEQQPEVVETKPSEESVLAEVAGLVYFKLNESVSYDAAMDAAAAEIAKYPAGMKITSDAVTPEKLEQLRQLIYQNPTILNDPKREPVENAAVAMARLETIVLELTGEKQPVVGSHTAQQAGRNDAPNKQQQASAAPSM